MKHSARAFAFVALILLFGIGCGKDEKSSADRDAEIQKALQQGTEREQKMYEGIQKGVQGLEKNAEQKEKK